MKRRAFLRSAAFAGAGTLAASQAQAQIVRPQLPIREVRNLVFLVYDGFSWENLSLAQGYVGQLRGRTLALERVLSLGVSGSMMTHSLSSLVTDSSSASTAWGTGRKTANANVGVYPDGQRLTNIAELAKQRGKAVGLITTTRVTHATPAGFVAHVLDRNNEFEIARQYLEAAPELMLGGGSRQFDPEFRPDRRDLFAEFAAAGYQVARSQADLSALTRLPVLGAFTPSHLPYEIDRRFQGQPGPSLAEMTRAGLELLAQAPRGFIAQIEAGRIDHANHNNDAGGMLHDILAADEALEVVLHFADHNPGTLVIVASDHGTGGAAVFGIGRDYDASTATLELVDRHRASYEFLMQQLGSSPSPGQVRAGAAELLGMTVDEASAEEIVAAVSGRPAMENQAAYNQQPQNTVAWILGRSNAFYEPDHLNVHFVAGSHTAGPVPIALYGAGASEARLGLVDNTEVFGWMTAALGVRFENPIMSDAEAKEILRGIAAARSQVG